MIFDPRLFSFRKIKHSWFSHWIPTSTW